MHVRNALQRKRARDGAARDDAVVETRHELSEKQSAVIPFGEFDVGGLKQSAVFQANRFRGEKQIECLVIKTAYLAEMLLQQHKDFVLNDGAWISCV